MRQYTSIDEVSEMESRSHKIYAWYCDFILLAAVGASVVSFINTIRAEPVHNPYARLMLIFQLGIPIIYYLFVADRISWNTPGELIAGRFCIDGHKRWLNPYGTNRWAIFLFTGLSLHGTLFLWSNNVYDHMYTYTEAGVILTGFLMIYYALIKIGQGVLKWSILLVAIHFTEMLLMDKNDLIIHREPYLLIKALVIISMTVAFLTYLHLRGREDYS